jgi:hypothetical protein
MISADDIQKALKILEKWKSSARAGKKPEAQKDLEHLEKVIRGLTR